MTPRYSVVRGFGGKLITTFEQLQNFEIYTVTFLQTTKETRELAETQWSVKQIFKPKTIN